MHRPAPGRYVTVTTAGEPFQAFVPAPLPPEPPVVWSAALRRRFDAALVALGRLDARHGAAAERGAPALQLRAQGGGAVVADRGHAVLARGPAAVRDRRAARRAGRRRARGQPLRGGARARPEEAARRAAAVHAPAVRDAQGAADASGRPRQDAGRSAPLAGVDRRHATRQRGLRAAAGRRACRSA